MLTLGLLSLNLQVLFAVALVSMFSGGMSKTLVSAVATASAR
jgi:hypothetical protein